MVNAIINFGLRGAQALFGIVTLGLAVTLIKGQKKDMPSTFGYAAFVGGISLAGALVGLASTWIELLQGIIGAGIDALIIFFNIAGGIVIAYKVRGINCSSSSDKERSKMFDNSLMNGGCQKYKGQHVCAYGLDSVLEGVDPNPGKLNSRCKENQADAAFMFMTAIVVIAAVTFTLLHLRRNK